MYGPNTEYVRPKACPFALELIEMVFKANLRSVLISTVQVNYLLLHIFRVAVVVFGIGF